MKTWKTLALATSIVLTGLSSAQAEPLQIITSKQTLIFDVEVAKTEEAQRKGLMNRDSLKENGGMLFIFDKPKSPQFWMKDTKISLDLLYMGEDGTIKWIHQKAIPYDTKPFGVPMPVKAVLEIPGKSVEKLGISMGDKVIYKDFVPKAK